MYLTAIITNLKTSKVLFCLVLLLLLINLSAKAQNTAYWVGNESTEWEDKRNWSTNAVPDANTHVIIGLVPFVNQPKTFQNNSNNKTKAECLSLTIGGGAQQVVLSNENINGLHISTDLVILPNGRLHNQKSVTTIKGNWTNNGSYTEEVVFQNNNWVFLAEVHFTGSSQTISGNSETKIGVVKIFGNVTLNSDLKIQAENYNFGILEVHPGAVLDPTTKKVNWSGDITTSGGIFDLKNGATIKVKAQNYLNNYMIRPTAGYGQAVAAHTSTIDYAGTIDQNIDNLINYQKLVISGTGVKSLIGNTTVSSGAADTEVNVKSATLDLKTHTLSRQAAGGSFVVANGATVKIGGANNAPVDFTTRTFSSASTVEYYGDIQTVQHNIYGHLTLSNTGAKAMPATAMTVQGNLTSSGLIQYSAAAALTVGGNINIGAGTSFSGGAFTHAIAGNWINNGTFVPGTGTIAFNGSVNTTITGGAIFNGLTINKAAANRVTLNNNATANTLNMTSGELHTSTNSLYLLSSRTGTGWVIGNLTRQHAFASGTGYAFNGPFAIITFTGASNINEVTMRTGTVGFAPTGFTSGKAINRLYEITLPGGTYTSANLQLQYLDSELNGCEETGLKLYYSATGAGSWKSASRHDNNTTDNWVLRNTLSNITGFWTLTDNPSTYRWDGAVSTAWENGANWEVITDNESTRGVSGPISSDLVVLGINTPARQPTISQGEWVKDISFMAPNKITVTMSGGSLRTTGNLGAVAGGAGVQHELNAASRTINIGGSLILNDSNAGNSLTLSNTSGTVNVTGNITHHTTGSIVLGTGNLNIGGNYIYTAGNFTPGTSTVTYNGTAAQTVGVVSYYNLTINKASGTATFLAAAAQTISNNLTMGAGTMALNVPTLNIVKDIVFNGGTLQGNSSTIDLKGNWTRTSGTFEYGTSTVVFSGSANQSLPTIDFYNLSKTKSNTLTTTGSSTIYGNLNVQSGILLLNGHTMNRNTAGGSLTLADNATLRIVGGTSAYPQNFTTNTLGVNSTVIYDTGNLLIEPVTYGYLTVQGPQAKTLKGNTRVANNMTIGSQGTLGNPGAVYTLTLDRNLTNNTNINAANVNLLFTSANATYDGAGNTNTIRDLVIATGAALTTNRSLLLYGSLTNNGNGFTAANSTLNFTGTAAATITSAIPVTINELLINKTGATPLVELYGYVNGLQTVNVNTGILDVRNNILTKKAAAGTTLTVANLATLKIGFTNSLPLFDSYSLQPTSTVVYNGSNQTIKSVQYGHLDLQNIGTATFEAGTAQVAGNMTKGTEAIVVTPQTIEFNGNTAQNMPGIDYRNLLISANGNKTLTGNATIANSLTFAPALTGAMLLAAGQEITLSETATLTGEQETSHIIGTIKTTRQVPASSTTTFGGIGIEINPGVPAGLSTMTRVTGQSIGQDGNSIERYYWFQPAQNAGVLNASIKASYFLSELDKDGTVPDHNENNLVLYSARFLTDGYTALSDLTNLNTTTKSIFVSGVNSINYLTISSPGIKPLPVELLYFKATKQDNAAVLEWKTASEKNNNGFEVEASADGYSYQKIGFVKSVVGTSAIAQNYTFTDTRNGKNGVLYYRLRQVDEDGTFKFYGPRTVNFGTVTKTAIIAYPNPFESEVKLAINAANDGKARLILYTAAGKIITQHEEPLAKGASVLQLSLNQNLPRGLYLLTVEQNGEVETLKLIKN